MGSWAPEHRSDMEEKWGHNTVGELRRLWLERRRFGEGSVGPGFSRQAPGNGAGWFEVRGPLRPSWEASPGVNAQ